MPPTRDDVAAALYALLDEQAAMVLPMLWTGMGQYNRCQVSSG